MEKVKMIERSLITTYRKGIYSCFIKAINEYELVKENDKICVCISGGKDSMVLAKLFQELQRHSSLNFEVEYVVMNPGYNNEILKQIKGNLNTDKIVNSYRLVGSPASLLQKGENKKCLTLD